MLFGGVDLEPAGHPVKCLLADVANEAGGLQLLRGRLLLVTQLAKGIDDQTYGRRGGKDQ